MNEIIDQYGTTLLALLVTAGALRMILTGIEPGGILYMAAERFMTMLCG